MLYSKPDAIQISFLAKNIGVIFLFVVNLVMEPNYFKGRGAQLNTANPFLKQEYVTEHIEGLDESFYVSPKTTLYKETPKKIVNKVDSPDLRFYYSANPYQGCEHGCIYCYARNSHQYWGFSAGLDFESKIIIKENAAKLLEKHFLSSSWIPSPIVLSGNTDCYQPVERTLGITRSLLKVFLKYGNPVNIITKNILILRDIDILKDLASENLVHVNFSVTTLNEKLRRILEPRTATANGKLKAIEKLSEANIPTAIMNAPIIPALNVNEMPDVIKSAANAGALNAGYTTVRLNGNIKHIFHDWLHQNFPDRANKVWNQICELHGGKVNDSDWGRRMKGDGVLAGMISQLFTTAKNKYLAGKSLPELNVHKFRKKGNLTLF